MPESPGAKAFGVDAPISSADMISPTEREDMGSPTIRRRQLSGTLRRLRHEREMTLDQVAEGLEWSTAKVSNIETGRTARPSVTDVGAILRAYGISETSREFAEIVDLARQSRERGWWTRYDDVLTGAYVGFEAEASRISSYEPLVIPGLLQTREYAEVHTRAAALPGQQQDIERAVSARMERQEILDREQPPELWMIIDEAALRRLEATPEVMRGQIRKLLEAAERDALTIQVLPLGKSLLTGLVSPFVILDYQERDVDPIVFLETNTDGLYLDRSDEVYRYRRLFEQAQSIASGPQESADMMRAMTP